MMESRHFVRWLWLTVLLLNLLMEGLATFTLRASWRAYDESSEIATQNLVLMLDREISGYFASANLSLLSMVDDYTEKYLSHVLPLNGWEAKLQRLHSILPILSDLGAVNAHGEVIWGRVGNDPLQAGVSDHDYFVAHRDNPNAGMVISSPVFSRAMRRGSLVLSHRLNDSSGNFTGIVTVTISLEFLYERFANLKLGRNGSIGFRDDGLRLA